VRTNLLLLAALSGALGCASFKTSEVRTVSATAASTRASSQQVRPQITAEGECVTAELVEHGEAKGAICLADAQAKGLTIVDLTDEWTPTLFQPTRDGRVPHFRDRYLELAQEKGGDIDALAELYGVVPAFAVVRARLADEQRHACHAAIDPKPILLLDRTYTQDHAKQVKASLLGHRWLTKQLETERAKRKLPTIDALEGDKTWNTRYVRWRKLGELKTALVTTQQKLRCEGWLLDKEVNGEFGWRMGDALEYFQRRNFLMPTERLDKETRQAMQLDSYEHDFRLALRILRERVVEAAGILEDGTAGTGPQPVLGRMLDPEAMRAARGHKPLPDAAPDLVGAATEAAAKHLGWTGPAEVRAFFEKYPSGTRVAFALPPVPSYYKPHMELSVVIDRGDVHYDVRPPARRRVVARRPTLVVYADDNGTKRPLVRWPTTIGGWADQRLPSGWLVQRWKESDVGPRIWKDLTAAPAWLPPKSTPDKELVRNLYNGKHELKTDLLGPGPRSAFGMALFEHVQVVKLRNGEERHDNNGIGTHGSSSVTSIVHGTSHGCHRLYNQLAVRLANFILHHREYVVKGEEKVTYRRNLWHAGQSFRAEVDTRGFIYELTPPVPVNVTKGRILSKRKTPPKNSAPARP
jgi:hypothetical protein